MHALKRLKLVLSDVTSKVLLFLLFVILASHLVVFVYYSNSTSAAQDKVNHNLTLRHVMNLIQEVRNAPEENRAAAANAIYMPSGSISVDKKPKYKQQFRDTTLWNILEHLSQQHTVMQLSLYLDDDSWLNISEPIGPASWALQATLLFLEVIAVLALFFSMWSIGRFTSPLKSFTAAAEQLGVDLHAKPLDIYGPAIVRETANAMNRMQARITELIQDRTQMFAAISHDLRTPITRLKLRAQFIDDPTLYEKFITDLDEMDAMIGEILVFTRDESHREDKEQIDLTALLKTLCKELKDIGLKVQFTAPNVALNTLGRPLSLKRVFSNLIDNAIKYGHVARVSMHCYDETIRITVEDDGPGIPKHQLESVFTPFYRAERSRSRETGGIGLGLAVVRDIIQAHHGQIRLEANAPRGLRAVVSLPYHNAPLPLNTCETACQSATT